MLLKFWSSDFAAMEKENENAEQTYSGRYQAA